MTKNKKVAKRVTVRKPAEAKTLWFEFRQNNSGGSFHEPAISVLVEARDEYEACRIAQEHGVYFEGVDAGLDCDCCGDRWSHPWRDGTPWPASYGEKLSLKGNHEKSIWAEREGLPSFLLVYMDGTLKELA